jgi:hypothetical protein
MEASRLARQEPVGSTEEVPSVEDQLWTNLVCGSLDA